MPRSFELSDFLISIAPNALCSDCIADRTPSRSRKQLPAMMSALGPPHFECRVGECAACCRIKDVACFVVPDEG